MANKVTVHRFYITIAKEDELRLEFDQLVNEGRTKAETFQTWMKHAQHLNFDADRGLWYANIVQKDFSVF